MSSSLGSRLAPVGIALVATLALVSATQLLDRDDPLGRAYSGDRALRLQTEALARGELSIERSPHGIRFDYAWSDAGVQQLWGLGVPLLRLPFDAAAKLVGATRFPDRFVLVLLVFVAALALASGLREAAPEVRPRWRAHEDAGVVLLAFCAPAVLALIGVRLLVYEEVVAHGLAWAFLSLGLLLRFAARRTAGRLVLAAAVAGFACVIRPTGVFYGAATILVLIVLALQSPVLTRRSIALALGVHALGPAFVLATNAARFGHPLEFGYAANISRTELNDYALRFGYPFADEPVGAAARELFAAMFLEPELATPGFYERSIHPWFSRTLRFRDFDFGTFDLAVLGIGIAGLALVLAALFDPRLRRLAAGDVRLVVLPLWAALALVPLVLFYLRAPSLTSRYLMDLHPAMSAWIAATLLALPSLLRDRWRRPTVIALWSFVALWGLAAGRAHLARPEGIEPTPLLTAQAVASELTRYRAEVREAVARAPDLSVHTCEAPTRPRIAGHAEGWYRWRDCAVGPVTLLYLAPARCVELDVEGETEGVRAMSNTRRLERVSARVVDVGVTRVTFCHARDAPARVTEAVQQVSIGWVAPSDLETPPQQRLLRAAATRTASSRGSRGP